MVTNQLFCSLISWLVSTSWVDIQYPQSMFFHEKWPSFTTFLKICKHVLQFIISARALTKVLYLFCAAGLLSIIYFQGWLWFQCRTLSDFNKCQTWFKNRCLANLNLSDFFGRVSVTFGDFRKMCNVTKNPAEVSVSPLDGSVRTEWPLPKNTSCKNDCIIN